MHCPFSCLFCGLSSVCSSSDFLVAYHSACMDSSRAGRFPEATARLIPISTVMPARHLFDVQGKVNTSQHAYLLEMS